MSNNTDLLIGIAYDTDVNGDDCTLVDLVNYNEQDFVWLRYYLGGKDFWETRVKNLEPEVIALNGKFTGIDLLGDDLLYEVPDNCT